MSSWELVSQLFWMPFDIMTRITRQFFHLGRNVYGSLFGTRPAIKPPPSPSLSSPPPTEHLQHFPLPEHTSHNSALSSSSSPPSTVFNPIPTCVIDITGTTSSLEACAASSMNHLELLSATTITSSAELQQVGNNSERAVADTNLHANVAHAISGEEPTTTIEGKKRLGDNAKRRTVTSKQKKLKTAKDGDEKIDKEAQSEADSSSVVPPQSKKPKFSEEEPTSSVSSAVATSNSNPIKTSKKRKKRAKKKNNHGEETGEQEGGKMGRSIPPNFFIAVQVSNKDIISKVANLQKSLSEKTLASSWHGLTTTEVFKDAMVPVTKLHFTLHVMQIGQQQIEKAQSAFKECCSEIGQGFIDNPLDLTIEGLGHFKSSVLFAQIKDEVQVSRLTQLSDHFRKKFNEINIEGDPRPFKPHLTIAKTSRSNKLQKMRVRSFPSDIWSGLENTNFGIQRVNGVQLLFMSGEDKSTGYYKCLAQHDFHDSLVNNPTTTVPPTIANAKTSTSDQDDKASQENKVSEHNKIAEL